MFHFNSYLGKIIFTEYQVLEWFYKKKFIFPYHFFPFPGLRRKTWYEKENGKTKNRGTGGFPEEPRDVSKSHQRN